MKTVKFVVVTMVIAVVGVCYGVIIGNAAPFVPDGDQTSLEMVLSGVKNSVSSISSGKGTVVVYESVIKEGVTSETETTYRVAFRDKAFRMGIEQKIIKTGGGTMKDPDGRLLAAGEAIAREVAYNREVVTTYLPAEKLAITGSRTTASGRAALKDYEISVSVPNIGVVNPVEFVPCLPGYSKTLPKLVGSRDTCKVLEIVQQPDIASQPSYTWWFWVDTAKGFTVPLVQVWAEGGNFAPKMLVSEMKVSMKKYGDIWGPAKATQTEYRVGDDGKGYKAVERVITYGSDYELNATVSDSELQLQLNPGTKVHDEVLDADHVVPQKSAQAH